MGWTTDNEQRQAIALKAHDAYAVARQAMEKHVAVEDRLTAMEAAIDELHELLAELKAGNTQRIRV